MHQDDVPEEVIDVYTEFMELVELENLHPQSKRYTQLHTETLLKVGYILGKLDGMGLLE